MVVIAEMEQELRQNLININGVLKIVNMQINMQKTNTILVARKLKEFHIELEKEVSFKY